MRFSPEKYEEVKRMRLILFSLSPLSSILFPQSHRYSFHANTAVLQLITHNLELRLLKLLFFFLVMTIPPKIKSVEYQETTNLLWGGLVILFVVSRKPAPSPDPKSESFFSIFGDFSWCLWNLFQSIGACDAIGD